VKRRRNRQLGLFADEAPRVTPPRRDVWKIGDGGVAPHSDEPSIPKLDPSKLPKEFQGNKLRKQKNGDWIMWPSSAKAAPEVEGSGSKAKWRYEDEKGRKRTAIGGAKVGRDGKRGWIQGGLNEQQLQAIQFAAKLKGSPEKRAEDLIRQNALFVINHSAGKDSQAMFLYVHRELGVPAEQIVILHADLPGADWPSLLMPSGRRTPTIVEHIQNTVDGLPVRVVVARWGTGAETPEHLRGEVKTFHEYVRHRKRMRPEAPSFPSRAQRWCTSDLKTGPLEKAVREELCVRNDLREAFTDQASKCKVVGEPWRIVVSCEGIRAGESADRALYEPWKLDLDNSKQGRIWFHWLPIFDWTSTSDDKYVEGKQDVIEYILSQGQEPFWTYGATSEHMALIQERAPGAEHGVSRLSCQFCIFGSRKDQAITAQLDPEAYARMCALEKDVGSSVSMGGAALSERTGIVPTEALTRKVNPWKTLSLSHPAGGRPDEEFRVHDLQLMEMLMKGNPEQRKRKRRLMGHGASRSRRHSASRKPQATPYPGVTLVPRSTGDPRELKSFEVLVDGRRVGAIDQLRVGATTKWASRTSQPGVDKDRIALQFFDAAKQDKALAAVLEQAKVNRKRSQVKARARRNEGLKASLAGNPDLQSLKRKLMR